MALAGSTSNVPFSPLFTLNESPRQRSSVLVRSVTGGDPVILPQGSVRLNGCSVNGTDTTLVSYADGGRSGHNVPKELEPLWDDGYGTQTLKDYIEISMDLIKCDGGPPRWFCPIACGMPIQDSPVLLFLPGMDGTGAGLVVHEKALGKVFHVQCLHIPVQDRTPFEGLIQVVEETVMIEHNSSPNKPIYLLGDSFGGTLALAVAARNPTIDLILILANPATSCERSFGQLLLSSMSTLPEEHFGMFQNVTGLLVGDFVKMAMVDIDGTNHLPSLWQFFGKFIENNRQWLSLLARIAPKDTLLWRLKLIESGAAYANSHLHAITAEVLVLASGKDILLPSKNEAKRLSKILRHCNVRVFEDNGHTILLESGVNVLSAIKITRMYRRFSQHDILMNYLPVGMTEFKNSPVETWCFRLSMGATMFSTMEDGKIVRGLAGIPEEGPVLLVGNHMLWGFDVIPLVSGFLRQRKVVLHGLAHPEIFQFKDKDACFMLPYTDILKQFGAIPVSGRSLFRLFANKSHVLLYPGGAREALHRKGECCKLFWPDKQEFVRMAMKFGTTIIPFGSVGEDDMSELIVDYNEMKRIPFFDQIWNEYNEGRRNLREGMDGEVAEQPLHFPLLLPKLPGRLYYFFGKPIQTKGKENMLDNKGYLQDLYLYIKREVEKNVAYLLRKREEDPFRGCIERLVWHTNYGIGDLDQIPSFKP